MSQGRPANQKEKKGKTGTAVLSCTSEMAYCNLLTDKSKGSIIVINEHSQPSDTRDENEEDKDEEDNTNRAHGEKEDVYDAADGKKDDINREDLISHTTIMEMSESGK